MNDKSTILQHLVWMAGYDKHYAWSAAKQRAAMLPELLKREMLAHKPATLEKPNDDAGDKPPQVGLD